MRDAGEIAPPATWAYKVREGIVNAMSAAETMSPIAEDHVVIIRRGAEIGMARAKAGVGVEKQGTAATIRLGGVGAASVGGELD